MRLPTRKHVLAGVVLSMALIMTVAARPTEPQQAVVTKYEVGTPWEVGTARLIADKLRLDTVFRVTKEAVSRHTAVVAATNLTKRQSPATRFETQYFTYGDDDEIDAIEANQGALEGALTELDRAAFNQPGVGQHGGVNGIAVTTYWYPEAGTTDSFLSPDVITGVIEDDIGVMAQQHMTSIQVNVFQATLLIGTFLVLFSA